MELPGFLQTQLEAELANTPLKKLAQARHELSLAYSTETGSPSLSHSLSQKAYLLSRLPTIYQVLTQILKPYANLEITSLLDIGAGPGTATWATLHVFPGLQKVIQLEREKGLLDWAKTTAQVAGFNALVQHQVDLTLWSGDKTSAQLVISSYCFNELKEAEALALLAKAWQATQKLLLLVEPGTPRGFQRLRLARNWLLEQGASLLAPCPHALPCPLAEDDWCHFSQRVPRSKVQRYLKQGEKSFEDEKFSYLLCGPQNLAPSPAGARILRHPQIRKGQIELTLCTPQGQTENQVITKKSGPVYKAAKKLNWGDRLPLTHG